MRTIEGLARRVASAAPRLAAALVLLLQADVAHAGIELVGARPTDDVPEPLYVLTGDLTGDGLADVVIVTPSPVGAVRVFVAAPDTQSNLSPAQTLSFASQVRGPALVTSTETAISTWPLPTAPPTWCGFSSAKVTGRLPIRIRSLRTGRRARRH